MMKFLVAVLCCVFPTTIAFSCDAGVLANLPVAASGSTTVAHYRLGDKISLPDRGCGSSTLTARANLCRVTANVPTSDKSSIYMEVWLPDNWDRRYVSTGNGGLNGCIDFDSLLYMSGLGLAAGGANGGHDGATGFFFEHNVEVIKDYSFRSVHTLTIDAKAIVQNYYGSPQKNAYYFGCSTGGRQGLQSAQMFPEDFDGIAAGAAAADFNHLVGWSGTFLTYTGPPGAPTFLSSHQWHAVHDEVLRQCDGLDGILDGIIENIDQCNFDSTRLLCGTATAPSACLTQTQVGTVNDVFSPLRDSNGVLLYPALQPGTQLVDFNGIPSDIPTQWYEFAILNDTKWDPFTLSIANITFGSQLDLGGVSTWNGNLSAFRTRGGKLQTYHGLADHIITSANSERYYRHVSSTMNLPPTTLDSFYRYFRISGMDHCSGGNGAWEIGQANSNVPTSAPQNILFSLFDWVENNQAPDTLLGTKHVNDNPSSGMSFQRNHCRFPYQNTYIGGDSKLPASWTCKLNTDATKVLGEET